MRTVLEELLHSWRGRRARRRLTRHNRRMIYLNRPDYMRTELKPIRRFRGKEW